MTFRVDHIKHKYAYYKTSYRKLTKVTITKVGMVNSQYQ